jgi:hypothetical protein
MLDANNKPVVAYSSRFMSSSPYPWFFFYGLRISSWGPNGWQFWDYNQWEPPLDDTHYSTILSGSGSTFRIIHKMGTRLQFGFVEGASIFITVVDQGGSTGTHSDLVVDPDGRLHATAHEAEFDGLRYAVKDQNNWLAATIVTNAGFEASEWTSLAVSQDGRPYILFDSYERIGFTPYIYFDGVEWIWGQFGIEASGFVAGMGRDNHFHAAFTKHSYCVNTCLYYVRTDQEMNWLEFTTPDSNTAAGQLNIALDTADFPHIAYPGINNLRYAVETPSGWLTTTVTPGKINYPSLALDRYNSPHIAWYDTIEKDLRYAAFDGTEWQVMTLDSSGDTGQYPSLAVDRLGRVYISYYDATNQDLKYTTFDGNAWTITTLLSDGDVGSFSKLVLPYAGYPAIAYYDATSRDLMLIYRPFLPTNFAYMPVFPAIP